VRLAAGVPEARRRFTATFPRRASEFSIHGATAGLSGGLWLAAKVLVVRDGAAGGKWEGTTSEGERRHGRGS
jgi:hypothetical protein